MEYNFREIEKKWQAYWAKQKTFAAEDHSSKPKYYVLDMFPYPSGAGLHVGHPLGYIASDIVARYKRHKGFNVLHPMGYDSFGLPAEQYAIQTGQHPAITTENNINRYREQLDKIGFSFDWDREVRTSNPDYYKWTQWIFIKLFHCWYNPETNKAEPIEKLVEKFKVRGSKFNGKLFSELNEKEKSEALMDYRLAYLSEAMVNWCPALGTVLANEEVKDGVSERGGYPVERKLMPQWSLRITAYADRLLNDLDGIDWSESIKEAQRNWIGKSEGCSLRFTISGLQLNESSENSKQLPTQIGTVNPFIEVFTTRPDTIFGVSFVTLAPEHELVEKIATPEYKTQVNEYVTATKNRSERERMADVKKVTGQFTGAYVLHPFNGKQIPIWIGDYVLAGYGTGAVMGVPAHDSRDFAFAKHFDLERPTVILPSFDWDFADQSYDDKIGKCVNSDFLNGLEVKNAIKKCIEEIEKRGLGKGKTNYRLRDAIFGRQRYWGEPIPVYYKDGIPHTMEENELPLILPEVDKYLPTETGEPPLARAASSWKYKGEYEYEKTTMPGWAGSSWYFLRYMDAKNKNEFASKDAVNYWKEVDLYIGGSEHATGHLLYVRFWTKFLFDLGYIPVIEPAKKLINQGMIQGVSAFPFAISRYTLSSFAGTINYPVIFISKKILEERKNFISTTKLPAILKKYNPDINFTDIEITFHASPNWHILVDLVDAADKLNVEAYKEVRKKLNPNANFEFICEDDGSFICQREVEKMSKSKLNVISPDDIVENYGADCLRMYEMFLGPLEQSKPWSTNGISGVSNFIRKFWRMFHQTSPDSNRDNELQTSTFFVSDEKATKEELKTLHKTIKKITEDIENYSFNTSISAFMICVNELSTLKCNKSEILEPLVILISPYAPHIAEELWNKLGHKESVEYAAFPSYKEEYIKNDSVEYPVSINGKTRFKINIAADLNKEQVEKEVMSSEEMKKYLNGSTPKKVIVVPGRIVNVVL